MDEALYNQCLAVTSELDAELGWGLSVVAKELYCRELVAIVPSAHLKQRMHTIVQNYHNDRKRWYALISPDDPDYNYAWEQLTKDIARILQKSRLVWLSDQAVNQDDLIQIASSEVASCINTFRFESRFTTWLTAVVVRTVQRVVRDSLAQKRAVRPEPIDQLEDSAIPEDNRLHIQVSERLLLEKIAEILSKHSNPLVLQTFLLRFYHDRGTKEIGELLFYHPSRIRALLAEAKILLQQDPSLRDWLKDQQDSDEPGSV